MGKTCVICGKPSGIYPLCREHLQLKNEGKVIKCEDCGTWHYANRACPNCNKNTKARKEESKHAKSDEIELFPTRKTSNTSFVIEEEPNDMAKCIACGDETEPNHWFCKKCYHLYKNKALILKITDCTRVEILDESYEGTYTCEDGHVVKSKSEMAIDNYLFQKHISHSYEPAFPIDEDPKHDLHPDFYLPETDVYIEHWGFDETNRKYTETKKYKLPFYEREKITMICTTEKDMKNITAALDRKLKYKEVGKINFLDD